MKPGLGQGCQEEEVPNIAGMSSSSSSSIRLATGFTNSNFLDYENEDDDEDEKQSNRHFRRLPLESLLLNCLEEATSSKHGL
jgi:hypothetical protein